MSIENITVADLALVDGMHLLLNVDSTGKKAKDWAEEHKESVQRLLRENGALLIRGLKIQGSKQFGTCLEILFGSQLLEYTYRSTPRTEMRGSVYTATEYPANETISQHNENAYARSWPMRIALMCLLPSEEGGETPISDTRLVYPRLSETQRKKFETLGIMYVRNYSDLDLPWSEVFQTEDKAEVEKYCHDNDLSVEWLQNNGLRTRQINPAIVKHPQTGEALWFNQAHLFHVSNLSEEMQKTLIDSLGEPNLPRNTYYGDGSAIEPEILAHIRQVYQDTKVSFSWQKNDLLLLDNMYFTHGREAYKGNRKVLVGMACPNV